MDFSRNPSAKLPHRGRLSFLVLEGGCGVPVLRKAFLQGSPLVVRLLCSRPHNNPYVVLVKMRLRIWNLLRLAHSPSLRAT
jgi:hypothetical protein